MENLEESGFWWLPFSPENQVPGILTFSSSDGIGLSLMGSFQNSINIGELSTYRVILGLTKRKLVTLYECRCIGSGLSIPGFMSQEYRASIAFIGAHFTKSDELRFHKITLEYSYLPDWAGLLNIQEQTLFRDQQSIGGYQLTYTLPEKISATTAQATVSIIYTFAKSGNLLQSKLSQSAFMLIETQEELTFEDWNSRFINPIQNFLSLATDRPNFLTKVESYSKQGTRSTSDENVQQVPIQVIFSQNYYYYEVEREKQLLQQEDMIFTLKDIESDFGSVIERWLKLNSELDSVCNLFFSVQYSPHMYLEHKFTNITQAIESYHRRRFRNQSLTEEEHHYRLEAIFAETPEDYRDWLREKLKYSNEPSFRNRIKIGRAHV